MSTKKIYLAGLLLLTLMAISSCNNSGKRIMPRMYPKYLYRDKQPMGTNIAYRLLPQQFNGDIVLSSKNLKGVANELSYVKGTTYISIGKDISFSDKDLEQLLNYVNRGNEFFISANSIDYRLLDTLGIRHEEDVMPESENTSKRNTFLRVADTVSYGKKLYGFFYFPFNNIFSVYDSSITQVLGVNENRHPDYLVVKYGRGKFYFHTEPAAFSNYFLLTGKNSTYYSEVFSYLNKNARTVYWADTDRFGKREDDFSALSIFWKNPLLKYALLLTCALMLLYIAFGSKRKRRLVPVLPTNANASLSFVQTIGNLYLQKKDNRNIAVKKMTYFLEYVRSTYHINTNSVSSEFVQSLSRKSGVAETTVQLLMDKAEQVNASAAITDQELFEINNLIEAFYKR